MASPLRISGRIELDASSAVQGGQTAVNALAGVGKAADQTSERFGMLEKAAAGLGTAADRDAYSQRIKALGDEGRALDDLRARYNPLYAAMRTYKQEAAAIEAAHSAGVLSTKEMTAALEQQRQTALRSVDALKVRNAELKSSAANQNFNTGNLAAQGQDIAVTAFMGMDPLMIGLQQGTQVASIVSTMEKPVAGLAAAFASLISPVSLVTVGLVAGSAALIQYFTAADEGTDGMSAELEAHIELISRVAQQWGTAAPELKSYADRLKDLQNAKDVLSAGDAAAVSQFDGLGEAYKTITQSYTAAVRDLKGGGAETASAVATLQTAMAGFGDEVRAGTATTEDLVTVQKTIDDTLGKYTIPSVEKLRAVFASLVPQMQAAIDKAAGFRNEAAGIAQTLAGPNRGVYDGVLRNADGPIQGAGFMLPDTGPVPGRRPNIELNGDPDEQDSRVLNSDGYLVNAPIPTRKPNAFEQEELSTRKTADDLKRQQYDRLLASQDLELEKLRAEISLVGESSTVRAEALRAIEAEGRIRELGIERNSVEAEQIREKSRLMGELTTEIAKQKQAWDMVRSASESAIDGAIDKLVGGDSKGALKGIIGDVGKFFQELGSNSIKNMLLGGDRTELSDVIGRFMKGAPAAANQNAPSAGFQSYSAPVIPVTRAPVSDISAYAKAIQFIESSGNYGALGPMTRNGDRAYGAYQVMGNNIGPWSEAALGRRLSPSQFLSDKASQDAIFNHRFGGYAEKYGASGAAQAWFGGPGSVGKGGKGSDILGTTGNEYVEKFNAQLRSTTTSVGSLAGASTTANKGLGILNDGLGQAGQNLANLFPSAPSSGGGGILSSILMAFLPNFVPNGAQANWAVNNPGKGLFDVGGHTGNGPRDSIAGFVHGQEFVVKASVVAQPGVRRLLEGLNSGSGYDQGGFVSRIGAPASIYPSQAQERQAAAGNDRAAAGMRDIIINVDNPRGDRDIEDAVDRGVAKGLRAYDKNLPARFDQIKKRPYVRGQ